MKNMSVKGIGAPLYIIDGYNVILNRKEFSQGRSVNESREYFTRLLDAYASKKKVDITVVWDGSGNSSGIKKLTLSIKEGIACVGVNIFATVRRRVLLHP